MLRMITGMIVLAVTSRLVMADLSDKANGATKKLPQSIRLMSEAKDKQLRQSLPAVEDAEVQALLQDPDLIFYSETEMPPAYQDWSSGLRGVHSPQYNISSNRREPFGNGNVEFPWGTAGGTHRTHSVSTFRFLRLPTNERGERYPVVWYRKSLVGSSQEGYAWTFPVGTVVGEVLQMRTPDGKNITFEMRLRVREYGEWAADVYRPFPTCEDLAARIKELRPEWQQEASLVELVQHLEQPRELKRHTLADNHPSVAFRRTMGIDSLPPVGDNALVKELLTSTPFRSSLGELWREGTNGVSAAAPTTTASFHVVPANYDAGFIEVDRSSCMSCHETVNKHVQAFDFGRDWYGRIRGSDGIFSLHPFDPSSISYNGISRPARINQSLVVAGLFERYDGSKHSSDVYQRLEGITE